MKREQNEGSVAAAAALVGYQAYANQAAQEAFLRRLQESGWASISLVRIELRKRMAEEKLLSIWDFLNGRFIGFQLCEVKSLKEPLLPEVTIVAIAEMKTEFPEVEFFVEVPQLRHNERVGVAHLASKEYKPLSIETQQRHMLLWVKHRGIRHCVELVSERRNEKDFLSSLEKADWSIQSPEEVAFRKRSIKRYIVNRYMTVSQISMTLMLLISSLGFLGTICFMFIGRAAGILDAYQLDVFWDVLDECQLAVAGASLLALLTIGRVSFRTCQKSDLQSDESITNAIERFQARYPQAVFEMVCPAYRSLFEPIGVEITAQDLKQCTFFFVKNEEWSHFVRLIHKRNDDSKT